MITEIKILFQTNDFVIVDKPAGVVSEAGGVPDILTANYGGTYFPVHRLDKDTSGVLLLAKNSKAAGVLSKVITAGEMQKEYLAVVSGYAGEKGIFEDWLYRDARKNKSFVVKKERKGVKKAILEFETINKKENVSLVKVKLHTGRSHQIRVQFASRKMPVLGDMKYGSEYKEGKLALHSYCLEFVNPFDKSVVKVISPAHGYGFDIFD